jgi:hypothetical protein
VNTGEKPGCLGASLNALGLGPARPGPGALPYRTRDDFLSPAELNLYRVLQTAVAGWATICPKVSLDDLFYARGGDHKANVSYRNQIARKHVDFLLCDPLSMVPLAGIELDDASHQRGSRQARDRFVEGVFAASGLPLLRVPVQAAYNVRELSAALRHASGLDRDLAAADPELEVAPLVSFESPTVGRTSAPVENPAPSDRPGDGPPACPRCGQPMVLRVVKKDGPHKGKRFWGCRDFPRCRGMRETMEETGRPA